MQNGLGLTGRTEKMLNMTTRFSISADVISSTNKDGTIILNVKAGVLYSVIGAGSAIWTRLSSRPQGPSLQDIVSAIVAEFSDVSEQDVKRDVEMVLNQFIERGILEVNDEKTDRIYAASQAWSEILVQRLTRTLVNSFINLRLMSAAAFLELACVDLALKIGGFSLLHRLVKTWPLLKQRNVPTTTAREVCESVNRAGRFYMKHALCLQRSAAVTCLLRSKGVPAEMVIACRKTPFEGHAWVEVEDQVINDTQKVRTFYSSVLGRC
jgi:hypothetical protein